MSDNKARRVTPHVWKTKKIEQIVDDPNGTHMLVPVEVWERAQHTHRAKYVDGKLVRACDKCGLDLASEIHRRALAEIGGE